MTGPEQLTITPTGDDDADMLPQVCPLCRLAAGPIDPGGWHMPWSATGECWSQYHRRQHLGGAS